MEGGWTELLIEDRCLWSLQEDKGTVVEGHHSRASGCTVGHIECPLRTLLNSPEHSGLPTSASICKWHCKMNTFVAVNKYKLVIFLHICKSRLRNVREATKMAFLQVIGAHLVLGKYDPAKFVSGNKALAYTQTYSVESVFRHFQLPCECPWMVI